MSAELEADTFVAGATGLIGRWLLCELTRRGRVVAALVREATERAPELRAWVAAHDGVSERLIVMQGDLTEPELGLSSADEDRLNQVCDVYNVAGQMAFGLSLEEARIVNVDGALGLAEWAEKRPHLRRLVHVSGYRVGADGSRIADVPSPEEMLELVAASGAYEATKLEADRRLQALSLERGLPLTIVNPATVIGDSVTGEITQVFGLGDVIEQLWLGKLPALVGSPDTFVPVVAVDELAAVLAEVVQHDEAASRSYWALDPTTPPLPALIEQVGKRIGVSVPKVRLPVGLVRRLPRVLTGVEPESLSFLSEDRYDTDSYRAIREQANLSNTPATDVVNRWTDYLIASRFCRQKPHGRFEFTDLAGSRTLLQSQDNPEALLLHGLPLDATCWASVTELVSAPTALADLPGVGRSSPLPGRRFSWETWDDWMDLLLDRIADSQPITLVGHSFGCALAVRAAHRLPERISGVVAVSPFFLQPRPPWVVRSSSLPVAVLRRASAQRLEKMSTPVNSPQPADAYYAAAQNLRRRGVARHVSAALRAVSSSESRALLQAQLEDLQVPVRLVVGQHDPIQQPSSHPTFIIAGAGHNPHISHPAAVAEQIQRPVMACW